MRTADLKATYSIVAADPASGEVGCAVQSRYFAVGNVVPWAESGVGAVATQAAGVAVFGRQALEQLRGGATPDDALQAVLAPDEGRERRQLGVVTADGRAAAFTGSECSPWAGHRTGDGYAVQGNILAGEAVVVAMEQAFLETDDDLAERLVRALEAGEAAGGDARGRQSAAVVVERVGAANETREGVDRVCDLRVDDHPEPLEELRRLLGIHVVWDVLRRATVFYQDGAYERGVELQRAALDRHGEHPVLLYDLACFESLAGDLDNALAHIERACAADPGLVDNARVDGDLAAIADHRRFRALVGPA